MAHVEICPVCKGKGNLESITSWKGIKTIILDGKPVEIATPNPNNRKTKNETVDCHGCNGKGWVEVSDTYPPTIKQSPWPNNPGWVPC